MKAESLYDESWVMLARFYFPGEARMAADLLEQAGIPAYVLESSSSLFLGGRGTSSVHVKACDLDRAKEELSVLK